MWLMPHHKNKYLQRRINFTSWTCFISLQNISSHFDQCSHNLLIFNFVYVLYFFFWTCFTQFQSIKYYAILSVSVKRFSPRDNPLSVGMIVLLFLLVILLFSISPIQLFHNSSFVAKLFLVPGLKSTVLANFFFVYLFSLPVLDTHIGLSN